MACAIPARPPGHGGALGLAYREESRGAPRTKAGRKWGRGACAVGRARARVLKALAAPLSPSLSHLPLRHQQQLVGRLHVLQLVGGGRRAQDRRPGPGGLDVDAVWRARVGGRARGIEGAVERVARPDASGPLSLSLSLTDAHPSSRISASTPSSTSSRRMGRGWAATCWGGVGAGGRERSIATLLVRRSVSGASAFVRLRFFVSRTLRCLAPPLPPPPPIRAGPGQRARVCVCAGTPPLPSRTTRAPTQHIPAVGERLESQRDRKKTRTNS